LRHCGFLLLPKIGFQAAVSKPGSIVLQHGIASAAGRVLNATKRALETAARTLCLALLHKPAACVADAGKLRLTR
jgi:hypothetical protein